jgi:hypothetical protein
MRAGMKPPYLLIILHGGGSRSREGPHTAMWVGLSLPTAKEVQESMADIMPGERLFLVDGPGEIYPDTITDFGSLLATAGWRSDQPAILTDLGQRLLSGEVPE